jgi:hypothetical protein
LLGCYLLYEVAGYSQISGMHIFFKILYWWMSKLLLICHEMSDTFVKNCYFFLLNVHLINRVK